MGRILVRLDLLPSLRGIPWVLHRQPAAMIYSIIKPWPFHGWGLDFIGQIHPPSSKGHRFVLVATDYFTKWTEAIPLKNVTHKEVIEFITEHIIHRFGIPQTLTTDQGTLFVSKRDEGICRII